MKLPARAASQNEQYLELMETPDFSHTAQIAKRDRVRGVRLHLEPARMMIWCQLRMELLGARICATIIGVARAARDEAETSRRGARALWHAARKVPACKITIRYLYQVLRGFPKEQVFCENAAWIRGRFRRSRFVGINYVMPEDAQHRWPDYALHMKIVGFLHGLYPKVHISLHAGELAPGWSRPRASAATSVSRSRKLTRSASATAST